MTLVQASIADNGKSTILIADRLLTTRLSRDLPSYEFESPIQKIILKEKVGVGFAGSSLHVDIAISKIVDKVDFDEIIYIISDYISTKRKELIDKHIERLTGVGSSEFFTRTDLPIPQQVRGNIYANIKDFDINCHCLITGFDEKGKARIVDIDDNGDVIDATTFGVHSIGTGSPFSQIYFDQYGYDIKMSTEEAILFAFEAKTWAQAHTGVGVRTDMLVFKKISKKEIDVLRIYENSELMDKLEKGYKDEIDKRKEFRTNLLKEIFEESRKGKK